MTIPATQVNSGQSLPFLLDTQNNQKFPAQPSLPETQPAQQQTSAYTDMGVRGGRGQKIIQLLMIFLQMMTQLLGMSGRRKGGSISKPRPGKPAKPGQTIDVNGGGRVSYAFMNNSSRAVKIGFMQDPNNPMGVSGKLAPGTTATFNVPDGVSGYFAVADSRGRFQPDASRFEIFSDNSMANVNVSYIDGRNASFKVWDGRGNVKGDNKRVAPFAPSHILSQDSAGNPTIAGWYDGSTPKMQAGGAYLEKSLGGTGGAYIHPDDDRKGPGQNPMTMAQNPSTYFSISIGDA